MLLLLRNCQRLQPLCRQKLSLPGRLEQKETQIIVSVVVLEFMNFKESGVQEKELSFTQLISVTKEKLMSSN